MATQFPKQESLFKLSSEERLTLAKQLCDAVKERNRQVEEKADLTKEYAENIKALDKEIRVLAAEIDAPSGE